MHRVPNFVAELAITALILIALVLQLLVSTHELQSLIPHRFQISTQQIVLLLAFDEVELELLEAVLLCAVVFGAERVEFAGEIVV